jgi:plasmid stabilization system protein ParE
MIWRSRAAVARDLASAASWYEERRAGLGEEFLAAFRATQERVAASPRSFPIVYPEKGIRRAPFVRFPYALFYQLTEDDGIIVAVRHHRQHPRGWQRRS